jgi:hypothetical protein
MTTIYLLICWNLERNYTAADIAFNLDKPHATAYASRELAEAALSVEQASKANGLRGFDFYEIRPAQIQESLE